MDDIPMKFYWMGKDVDSLSHQEAIEAVKMLGRELESTRRTFKSIRKIDAMMADLRRS